MNGVIIPGNNMPNTRASLKFPSILEGDKGKKVIEGPPEVKEVSNPKMAEFFSEQVTTDANLALTIEEEEEVIKLTLRKKKKKDESKVVKVINPVERKNSKASGYIIQASQAEKEYFDKIKRAGNIFKKVVSKREMAEIRQLHRLDKGSDRKGREVDESQEISKKKLVFQSGGIVQSLSEIQNINEIDPETGVKKYKFFWEEMASKNMRSLVPLTRGGLGHSEEKMADTIPLEECARITDKLSEEVSQKHLDELISMQLVIDMHEGTTPKVKMLYFLRKWRVFILSSQELAVKHWKELEHVLYLLNPKDRECKRWDESIKRNIQEKKKVLGLRNERFSPKYINYSGKET